MEFRKSRAVWVNIGLVAAYLAVRFLFTRQLDGFGMYASYAFEAAFVALCLALHRKKFRLLPPKLPRAFLAQAAAALMLGMAVYQATKPFDIVIPFDFTRAETVFFLLAVGPLLEELLFRQALWHALGSALKDPRRVLLATAALFSFAHFHAYFFMPEPLQPFVLYQTAYTLALGLWWGFSFQRSEQAFLVPLTLHFGFNLGFYLGFRAFGII